MDKSSDLLRPILHWILASLTLAFAFSCVPALTHLSGASVATKVTLYRVADYFPVAAVALGCVSTAQCPSLWPQIPLSAAVLILLLGNSRGAWIIPGTFDRYGSSWVPVFLAYICVGFVLYLLAERFFRQRRPKSTRFPLPTPALYASGFATAIALLWAEGSSPQDSLVPASGGFSFLLLLGTLAALDAVSDKICEYVE